MRLIILRPKPGADATARAAQAAGWQAEVRPLFAVAPIAWHPPDPVAFEAILLSSANALRHGGPALQRFADLPALAVGAATAQAAMAAGWTVERVGEGSVADLLADDPRRLFHPSGLDRTPLPTTARVTSVAVYDARAIDPPPSLMLGGAITLVHSRRAAHRLGELTPAAARGDARIAAISPAVAEALGAGWGAIGCARRPDDAALLESAARLCQEGR